MATRKGAANPAPEKAEAVKILMDKLDQFPNMILTEYHGLTVKEVTALRRELRQAGAAYLVAKNNLVKIALHNHKNTELDGYLFGPTGIALAGEEVVAVAKILKNFQKKAAALKIKGGFAEGLAIDADTVMAMADLPSKEELYTKFLRTLNGPATSLARGLNDSMARLARVLNERSKQLAE